MNLLYLKIQIIGVQAGIAAGAYTVGLATGGTTFEELAKVENISAVYNSLLN